MALDIQDILLIEKHLEKDLSPQEQEIFNSRLKNKTFVEELKLYKAAITSIEKVHQNQLKGELKQLLFQSKGVDKSSPFFGKKPTYLAIVATITIIMIGVAILFFQSSKNNTELLFATYYTTYPLTTQTRGEENLSNHPALAKYNNGDYVMAAILLEQVLSKKNTKYKESLLYLLLGNCYLHTNNNEKAIKAFAMVMNSKEEILSEHGRWYYALTLLKMGKIDQLHRVLDKIKRSNSIYSEQATELNKQVGNL